MGHVFLSNWKTNKQANHFVSGLSSAWDFKETVFLSLVSKSFQQQQLVAVEKKASFFPFPRKQSLPFIKIHSGSLTPWFWNTGEAVIRALCVELPRISCLWSTGKLILNLEAGFLPSSSRRSLCHTVFIVGRKDGGLFHRDWEGGRKRQRGGGWLFLLILILLAALYQPLSEVPSEQEAQGSVWLEAYRSSSAKMDITLPVFLPGDSNGVIGPPRPPKKD